MNPQLVSLSLTVTTTQAKNILAALVSTDASPEISHTPAPAKAATKGGTSKKAAPVEEESYEEVETEVEETEEETTEDFTAEQVSKMMAAYAKKNGAEKAKKLLAKFKVPKVAQLSQVKLNELAAIIG